jgi:(R,R)-butanediol dehydrogenase/meso-butanediol dehydrogenase/diacetyl reductase
MRPEIAALGQPMSVAVHAARRGRPEAGDCAVVVGAGGIGAFLTFALADMLDAVIVTDLDPGRLQIASDLGASAAIRAEGDGLRDHIERAGHVPAVIYEVSGSAAGIRQALAVAPRGARIVVVGLQSHETTVNLRDVSLREIELIGTNAHVVFDDLPEALRLLAGRAGGWDDIAPTVLGLDQLVEEGLRPLAEGRSPQIKTLIDPWATLSRLASGNELVKSNTN